MVYVKRPIKAKMGLPASGNESSVIVTIYIEINLKSLLCCPLLARRRRGNAGIFFVIRVRSFLFNGRNHISFLCIPCVTLLTHLAFKVSVTGKTEN